MKDMFELKTPIIEGHQKHLNTEVGQTSDKERCLSRVSGSLLCWMKNAVSCFSLRSVPVSSDTSEFRVILRFFDVHETHFVRFMTLLRKMP